MVNCHQIKFRLNWALIFIVTATSDALFGPLGGCLWLLGAIIIELHSFLAQYFEPSILYIFSLLVEIPHWQCQNHRRGNNDISCIPWHQLHVLFPTLGVLVAVLDGCTVGPTWELLSMLRNARGRSVKCRFWCKRNAWHRKLFSPQVIDVISKLLVREVPGGCARWRLGCSVFVNQQNAGYKWTLVYLTSWIKKSLELDYLYPFFLSKPPFTFPCTLNTPPAFWAVSTTCVKCKTMPLVPKHTQ